MIRALFMDVDGTLTNGKIYIGEKGEMFKSFNIKDGYGISVLLKRNNITPIVLTGRVSKITENRCEELGIDHIYQGVNDKLSILIKVIMELSLSIEEVAFIGDDDNDLECMDYVYNGHGIIGCPNNSSKGVLNHPSIFRCKNNGGEGAVREFIEHFLNC